MFIFLILLILFSTLCIYACLFSFFVSTRVNNKTIIILCIYLQVVNLEGNDLRSLQKNAFTALRQAWYLNLEDNEISTVHKHAFRMFGGKNLGHHQIDLSNNKIRFISQEDLRLLIDRK